MTLFSVHLRVLEAETVTVTVSVTGVLLAMAFGCSRYSELSEASRMILATCAAPASLFATTLVPSTSPQAPAVVLVAFGVGFSISAIRLATRRKNPGCALVGWGCLFVYYVLLFGVGVEVYTTMLRESR
jgi:hypothetical protein